MNLAPAPAPAASTVAAGAALQRSLAGVQTGVLVLDAERVLYANPCAAAMFDRSPGALAGQPADALIAPRHRLATADYLRRRLAGQPARLQEIRGLRWDGSEFDVRLAAQPLDSEGCRLNVVTLTDVTALKDALHRAERKAYRLARSEMLCRSGSFTVRPSSGQVQVSAGLRALVGEPPQTPAGDAGSPCPAMTIDRLPWVPADEQALVAGLWRNAIVDEPFEFRHRLLCADGRCLVVLHRGLLNPPAEPGGEAVGIGIVQDVTAGQDAERRIQELANFDEITGLANRANLLQQLDAAVHAARREGRGLSLLSIEIPRIAELAGTMGFGAADSLAMAIAARLSRLRADDEQIAHLGGGEFALMRGHRVGGAAEPVAEPARLTSAQRAAALMQALQQPVTLGGLEVLPQCRIGIAEFPGDSEVASAWLEAAQAARLHATACDGVAQFMPESNARARRALQLETALRHALPRGELSLVYQPQACLKTGNIVGAEALLRWHSAEFGAVPPDEFIPVAERSGLISVIGDWVIRQACEQTVRWRQAGLAPIRVAINISPVQFQLGDVALSIQRALQETGANPSALAAELTESALLHNGDRVAATLRTLRASGIEIALDDFGTGYSSLSRLRTLPIDLLKIDRSFVSDVTAAPESASVTRSIINLAHGLQIPVLAEGVETEGQLNMLVVSGCDQIQGYFFSRPVTAEQMTGLLRSGHRLTSNLMPRKAGTRTLMLVDDESSVLSALKRLFRRDGYTIVTAQSGAEALELLAVTHVDVIISDQRMPGMTGVDFLRRAKALHPHTVRMTLSGFTDLQSIIDAVNEGAVYKFLVKPWDDTRLREHVAQAFAQKELADDHQRLQREVAGANADLAALNQRLAQLLEQQREKSQLMQASAGGARDVIDALPTAVFGLDPDGTIVYLNRGAAELMPAPEAALGDAPGPLLAAAIATLRAGGALNPGVEAAGRTVAIGAHRHLAWLRHLPGSNGPRGDLLVLTPLSAEQAP